MKKTVIGIALMLSASTAFAGWTWEGGETITSDGWKNQNNWSWKAEGTLTGELPAEEYPQKHGGRDYCWASISISNASGTVTGLEGWAVKLTLVNSTLDLSANKLQGTSNINVDANSTLIYKTTPTRPNSDGNHSLNIAGQMTFNMEGGVSDKMGNFQVTLTDGGSFTLAGRGMQRSLTLNLSQSNMFASSSLSMTGTAYELVSIKVIDYEPSGDNALGFNSVTGSGSVTIDGQELVYQSGELTLEADSLGKYTLSQGTDGVYLSYVTAVPEPATATLSLLALAGLCARRRRK